MGVVNGSGQWEWSMGVVTEKEEGKSETCEDGLPVEAEEESR